MKKSSLIIAGLVPLASWLYSCDNVSQIGSSIVEDQITVTVDTSFQVTGHSVAIERVQSRTISQLFGRIEANGYGRLSSDVVTQFMPATPLDTSRIRVENIDSMLLVMSVAKGEFMGDSLVPLGLNIYPLDRQLPSPIFSDFNPEDYYSKDDLMASVMYNLSNNSKGKINTDGHTDITVKLPLDFAKSLYQEYLANPSSFSSPSSFAKVFPGFYIKNSFGSGRLTRVTNTQMKMHYHYNYTDPDTGKDTLMVSIGNYFAVTPEIVSNNNVSFSISPELNERINKGENIVMGPVGVGVDMRFPAPEIIAKYNASNNPVKVFNSLTLSIPAENIENDFGIEVPTYLLMILSKEKDSFFANNKLPDNVTSFYAEYNSTTKKYSFGEMRKFILDLMSKENITEEDYTFSIVPVSAMFEEVQSGYYSTTSSLTMMTPYMSAPVMCKLNLDQVFIRLSFSTQTVAE